MQHGVPHTLVGYRLAVCYERDTHFDSCHLHIIRKRRVTSVVCPCWVSCKLMSASSSEFARESSLGLLCLSRGEPTAATQESQCSSNNRLLWHWCHMVRCASASLAILEVTPTRSCRDRYAVLSYSALSLSLHLFVQLEPSKRESCPV